MLSLNIFSRVALLIIKIQICVPIMESVLLSAVNVFIRCCHSLFITGTLSAVVERYRVIRDRVVGESALLVRGVGLSVVERFVDGIRISLG